MNLRRKHQEMIISDLKNLAKYYYELGDNEEEIRFFSQDAEDILSLIPYINVNDIETFLDKVSNLDTSVRENIYYYTWDVLAHIIGPEEFKSNISLSDQDEDIQ